MNLAFWLIDLYRAPEATLRGWLGEWGALVLIAVIAFIVFSETGLLAGFFLPGDSLLIAAGVLTGFDPPLLPYVWLMALLASAAIVGDSLNFCIGHFTGNRVWDRPDGRFFKRQHLLDAQEFFTRRGPIALPIARFIPLFRTFMPFTAGLARMRYPRFLLWSISGGVAWVCSMISLGHWLAGQESLRKNLHLLLLVVIFLSLIPAFVKVGMKVAKARRDRKAAACDCCRK